jgi:hypothetical protein
MKNFEKTSNSELVNFLSQSNEALRIENLRLMSEIERLANHIDVIDAEYISNLQSPKYYNYITNLSN